jgi:hypothetical protein
MADVGRPSLYSDDLASLICSRIAEGESLASICRDEGMPSPSTVRRWIVEDVNGFAALSARAYALGYEALAEECLLIADTPLEGVETTINEKGETSEKRGDMLQHRRLQIETRMRLLGKWAPKRYGDKVAVGGAEDLPPIKAVADSDETLRRLAFLLTKGAQGNGN